MPTKATSPSVVRDTYRTHRSRLDRALHDVFGSAMEHVLEGVKKLTPRPWNPELGVAMRQAFAVAGERAVQKARICIEHNISNQETTAIPPGPTSVSETQASTKEDDLVLFQKTLVGIFDGVGDGVGKRVQMYWYSVGRDHLEYAEKEIMAFEEDARYKTLARFMASCIKAAPKQNDRMIAAKTRGGPPNADTSTITERKTTDSDKPMTAHQAANYLGLSVKTVYNHPELVRVPTGTRKVLFDRSSVLAVKNSPPE